MSETYINRSLTTIHNELEFLLGENVISKQFYDQLQEKLPTKYNGNMPPVPAIGADSSSTNQLQAPSGPPAYDNKVAAAPVPSATRPMSSSASPSLQLAEALYDYKPTEPQDLEFRAGDKVEIHEKLNNDWWKGTSKSSGKSGLFPSNYVRPLSGASNEGPDRDAGSSQSQYNSAPPMGAQGYYNGPPNQYGPPGGVNNQYGGAPPQGYPYQQQPFPAYPLQNQQAYPAPQQQAAPVQAQPQQAQGSQVGSGLKRFGHKLGDAAIFGAGATIGSDIINSIF